MTSRDSAFRLGYRPALDGLRGAAVLCVLAGHLAAVQTSLPSIGVQVFFVLSGFLITSLLLEEWQATNQVSLRAFYARRALRLLPALGLLLVVFLAYSSVFHERRVFRSDSKDAAATLFYYMNWRLAYCDSQTNYLRHAWSLSIEEQFYLLWPALLLLLLKRMPRISLLRLVVLLAVLTCAVRDILWRGTTIDPQRLFFGLDTRADALLLGCAVAMVFSFGLVPRWQFLGNVLKTVSLLAALVLGCLAARFYMLRPFMVEFGWFIAAVSSGLIILAIVSVESSLLSTLLRTRALVFTGKISYGLYLWHWPVLNAVQELTPRWPFGRQSVACSRIFCWSDHVCACARGFRRCLMVENRVYQMCPKT